MTANTREDGPSGPHEQSLDVLKKPLARRSVEGTPVSGCLNSNMAVFSVPPFPSPNEQSLDVLKKPLARRSVEGTPVSSQLNSNMAVFSPPEII